MDKETYEKQKPFAGNKTPSMQRRFVGHDYTERSIYMITLVTEGRQPLFGEVTGSSETPAVRLSPLGECVAKNWSLIADHYPQIRLIKLQMMPDHLHGILFVTDTLRRPLGQVISGFKAGCNKDYRRLILDTAPSSPSSPFPPSAPSYPSLPSAPSSQFPPSAPSSQFPPSAPSVPSVVALPQQTKRPPRSAYNRKRGLLFASGYNDKVLLRRGQLKAWLHYLDDNPRRLLMKREHPDLFRVQRNLIHGNLSFSAIGNRFLLQRPVRLPVQCSRRLTETDIATLTNSYLAQARQGAVLISPAISLGEKAIMRAAFDEGLPLIYLQENGLTDLAKPGGARMEACARGQLLILAPWEHHNERITIRRNQCLLLNDMAKAISTEGPLQT